MSVILNINGTDFFYPEEGEVSWGPDATDWAVAVTSSILQKAGGVFTLTSDADFGATYGIKSIYFKSNSSDISSSGVLRLANADVVSFRNGANTGDLSLSVDATDDILFNGVSLTQFQSVLGTNSIQLSLVGGVLTANAKISSDPASAGFKSINLSAIPSGIKAELSNSDIQSSINVSDTNSIDLTKSAGNISSSVQISAVSTDGGFTPVALSIVPTGLKAEVSNSDVLNLISVTDTATIDLTNSSGNISGVIVDDSITNTHVETSAAIDLDKLETLTASKASVSNASGVISTSAVTDTEVAYLSGVTSAIQTQLTAKAPQTTTYTKTEVDNLLPSKLNKSVYVAKGSILASTAASTPINIPVGTNGQVLVTDLVQASGVKWVTPATGTENPMIAVGDAIVGGTSGAPTKLTVGTANQILSSGSGSPEWTDAPVEDSYPALLNAGLITPMGDVGQGVTAVSNPATLPGASFDTAFSPDGIYMSVATSATPYVYIYKRSGDTFTKLTNPSNLPTGQGNGTTFSPDGIYMSVAHNVSPYITIYKRSGDTFTKLTNPSNLPTGDGQDVSFSSDGVYMTVTHKASPYITIYKRSGDTFTKLTNPSNLPTDTSYSVAWSPDNTYMTVGYLASPYIIIYKRSGDTFTKLTNPSTLPTGIGYGVSFSPDGIYMDVGHSNSPYITSYKRSGDTFTKLANPADLPSKDVGKFNQSSSYLALPDRSLSGASPWISLYQRVGDALIRLPALPSPTSDSTQSAKFSYDGVYFSVVASFGGTKLRIYKADGIYSSLNKVPRIMKYTP